VEVARADPSMLAVSCQRTVTTIGLPARKEQLIRSMLLAVNARTTDRWTFADGLEADVAICDVDSRLAAVAVARQERDGRPHCVWLAGDTAEAPIGPRLEDPIGSSSLIALLESVSTTLRRRPAPAATSAPVAPPVVAADAGVGGRTALDVALMLRDLLLHGSSDTFQITAGALQLRVVPSRRAVRASQPLTDDYLARLLDPAANGGRIERLAEPDRALTLLHAPSDVETLWRAGLVAGGDALAAPLHADAPIGLARWPDFGRLPHAPAHVQMAARLSRRPHRVEELVTAVGRPAREVRAFVNACVLCGLVSPQLAASREPRPTATAAATARPAYIGMGILRSIRTALGLGGL